MTRQAILDEHGELAGWFDPGKATQYPSATYWDGKNHVCSATRDYYRTETLYRTAGGRWVTWAWSRWQNAPDSWRYVSAEDARQWLIRAEYSDDEIREAVGSAPEPESGPRVYLSTTEVATRIGVQRGTLSRYKLPTPDARIGDIRGWLPGTIDRWNAERPGRGARTDLSS